MAEQSLVQNIFGKKLQLEFLKYGKLNSLINKIEQGQATLPFESMLVSNLINASGNRTERMSAEEALEALHADPEVSALKKEILELEIWRVDYQSFKTLNEESPPVTPVSPHSEKAQLHTDFTKFGVSGDKLTNRSLRLYISGFPPSLGPPLFGSTLTSSSSSLFIYLFFLRDRMFLNR